MQTVDPPAFASAPKRWRSAHTHLAYKRGVTDSNPVAPTMFPQLDAVLTLEVALVEDLGSDSYIYGRLAGDADSHVIVRATRDHPRPGEAVKVKVDTAHLHLFDGATGLRVGE